MVHDLALERMEKKNIKKESELVATCGLLLSRSGPGPGSVGLPLLSLLGIQLQPCEHRGDLKARGHSTRL